MCAAAENCKKDYNLLFFRFQGHLRSFKVNEGDNIQKLVTGNCYDKHAVCLCLSATVFTLDELKR